MALALVLSAVGGVRGDSDQGARLLAVDFAQLRQFGDQGGAGDRSQTGDGLDDLLLALPVIVGFQQFQECVCLVCR
jgi:hypothetical protein